MRRGGGGQPPPPWGLVRHESFVLIARSSTAAPASIASTSQVGLRPLPAQVLPARSQYGIDSSTGSGASAAPSSSSENTAPLGFDGEGRTYRVNSDDVAVAAATPGLRRFCPKTALICYWQTRGNLEKLELTCYALWLVAWVADCN